MQFIIGAVIGAIATLPASLLYADYQLIRYTAYGEGGLGGVAVVSIIIVLGGSLIAGLAAHFGNRIRLAPPKQPD